MKSIERSDVHIAIAATPAFTVRETSGGEAFSGILANALVKQGFTVSVYGQEGATYPFHPEVSYIETGPTTEEIVRRDRVRVRKASNQSGVSVPLRLAPDVADAVENSKQLVIIDNDITTASLTPFTKGKVPHLFVQHTYLNDNGADIYKSIKMNGGKIVSIADFQCDEVTSRFGSLHDITIKNGIHVVENNITPIPLAPGEEIRVGTLSRIEANDIKGIQLAGKAVMKINEVHGPGAMLTIAGSMPDRGAYAAIIEPLLDEGIATYVGEKKKEDKKEYLAEMHVGAALSNPGGWDEHGEKFTGGFVEGYSLALGEMLYAGVIPVSTDSGGAEPLVDAGLEKYVVPLRIIEEEGLDSFVDLSARLMLDAAFSSLEVSDLRERVRTIDQMGEEYAVYIMDLVQKT